jgi:hypothetical protein
MAGIGEASAIIGIVQVGFSLAAALNTYVSEIREAREDILELASDIDSTFLQLQDLGKLIEQNESTKAWSDGGVKLAQKCVTDCQKAVAKLRKLLKKSTASAISGEVVRDEIDVTKLERALWPVYKPELLIRKQELRSIKQDILIAYASYNAKAGATELDRKRAKDNLPLLQRTRALVRKQVKDAKDQGRQRGASGRRPTGSMPRAASGPRYAGVRPSRPLSDAGSDDEIIYRSWEDLDLDFEEWRAADEVEKKRIEDELKGIEAKAVETWRNKQHEEIEAHRKQVEVERSKLRDALKARGMAEREISTMLDKVHPVAHVPVDIQALIPAPLVNPPPESVTSEESKSSRRRSIWSRMSSSGRTSTSRQSSNSGKHEPAVPKLLQDPLAEDGVAQLQAFYYQRMLGNDGERIRKIGVELPDQWLLETLIQREEKSRNNPGKFNSIWKEYSLIPEDYRYYITEDLSHKHVSYHRANENDDKWVLIYVECLRGDNPRRLLGRRQRGDVVGIYIVLKRNRKYQSRLDSNSEDGRTKRETITIRRSPSYGEEPINVVNSSVLTRSGSVTRRRPSRSFTRESYEDYHHRSHYDDSGRGSGRRQHTSRSPSPDHGRRRRSPSPPYDRRYSPSPERPPRRRDSDDDDEYPPGITVIRSGGLRERDRDRPPRRGDSEGPYYTSSSLRDNFPPPPTPYYSEHERERSWETGPAVRPPGPPRRQDSSDSYSARRLDRLPIRRDTDDSMDERDSRRHHSHSARGPDRLPIRRDTDDSMDERDSRHHHSHSARRLDRLPIRRDTDDSMDERDSRRYHSHRRASYDAYGERDRRRERELSDIAEVIEDLSLSDSSSSTGTEEDIDLEALGDLRQTDDVLRERILSEYTSPAAPGAGDVTDGEGGGGVGVDPVEPKDGEEVGVVSANHLEGARDAERRMTASPAPLHSEGRGGWS